MTTVMNRIETDLNPFPYYQEIRNTQPVYFSPERGLWNFFRYDDVFRVLSEYTTFSSDLSFGQGGTMSMPLASSVITTDPPRHRKLRSLVTQAFTPKAVEALAPRIMQIVREQLEPVLPTGRMDVVHDFAYPVPVIVIAELLGIPVEDRARFKHWSDVIVSLANIDQELDMERLMNPDVLEMSQYFIQIMEQRKTQPADDLISGLLAAEVDGEKLDLIELLGFCGLLLAAGNETTTNLLANAMHLFAGRSELWAQLRNDRELLVPAIEEALRFRSPVQCMFRVAKNEVEMDGQVIPAGSRLLAWIGAANHDPAQFPKPEVFDPTRKPNKHLAFGQGIHFCLGAPLARLEAKIALGALLERIEAFEIEPGARLERLNSMLVYGLKSLPIQFKTA